MEISKLRKQKLWNKDFFKDMAMMLLVLISACLASLLLNKEGFNKDNMIMVYMIGILVISLYARYKLTGLISIVASIFLFNFFFTVPVYTFRVSDKEYIVTFIMMFATFMIISNLVVKIRKSREETKKKAYRTEILFEASHKFQKAYSASDIASWTARQLGQMLECDVYCFLGKPEKKDIYMYLAERDNNVKFDKEEIAAADWAYNNGKKAGAATSIFSGAKCMYLAIGNSDGVYAVAGVNLDKRHLDDFEENLTLAMLNESALAFEKEAIRIKEQKLVMELEREQFRTNILRAVSHDLRTPLTSISGNAVMLIENYEFMEKDERRKILSDIYEDSVWLINLVENLLSVTRFENGTMNINLQPELMDDIISESVKHLKRHIGNRKLTVMQEEDILVARIDAKLIIQVITNLVDNAVKYTEEGSEIILKVRRIYKDAEKNIQESYIEVSVYDNGRGIEEYQKEKIFDMFYTGDGLSSDGRRGMGIGLALCKSIIEAHGGKIYVEDNSPKGSIFRFTLKAEEVNIE